MSNSKPAVESSTPSETVEQGLKPSENGNEEAAVKDKQNLSNIKGIARQENKGARKENNVLKKDVTENGKKESSSPANPKGRKRKFPSREEISKAR